MVESMSANAQLAEEHYQQGYHRLKAEEWELALEELRLCLKLNPLNRKYSRLYVQIAAHLIARHYQQVAEGFQLQGRFDEAINSYLHVLKLNIYPKHFKRLIRHSKQLQQEVMNMYEQAGELLTQEKLTKARRKAEELLEQTPRWLEPQALLRQIQQREQAQALYTQGYNLYRDGRYEEAHRFLKKSLALYKDFSAPQTLLERIKEKSGHGVESTSGLPLEESILLLEDGAEGLSQNKTAAEKPEDVKKQ